jgi:hypothetical protein
MVLGISSPFFSSLSGGTSNVSSHSGCSISGGTSDSFLGGTSNVSRSTQIDFNSELSVTCANMLQFEGSTAEVAHVSIDQGTESFEVADSMLTRDMRVKHRENYEGHLLMEEKKQKCNEEDSQLKQTNISRYVHHAPVFEKCCIGWIITMYQPISMIEESTFRKMCYSLTSKAPIIGKDKVR